MDASGSTVGTYGFRVLDLNALPITLFNTVTQDSLNPRNEDNTYRFVGHQGQLLHFQDIANSGNADWVLYGPKNQVVVANGNFNDFQLNLPENGEYILAVRGNAAFGSSVNYSFSIVAPTLPVTPLTLNSVTSGTISQPGEYDTYTFNGTAGQQLYYDALANTYANFTVTLYDPSGQQVYSGGAEQGDRGPDAVSIQTDEGLTLAQTGTYQLVINGNGATGAYSFRLMDKATGATPLPLSNVTVTNNTVVLDSGIITGQYGTYSNNKNLDTALYTFTGSNGELLYLHNINGNGNDQWYLFGPRWTSCHSQ